MRGDRAWTPEEEQPCQAADDAEADGERSSPAATSVASITLKATPTDQLDMSISYDGIYLTCILLAKTMGKRAVH
jgi:hypothetical protein